jgi:hypothetical protein
MVDKNVDSFFGFLMLGFFLCLFSERMTFFHPPSFSFCFEKGFVATKGGFDMQIHDYY